jgi:hypothetical protein
MRSHFLHMVVYSTVVSTFFATMFRESPRDRLRLGLMLWLAMVGGGLLLAWIMFPFPG